MEYYDGRKGDIGLRNRVMLILILMVSVLALFGYYVMNNNREEVSEERIRLDIEREISGIKNLDIKIIEKFRENALVVYTYDLGDGHYIACWHLDKHKRLSGGSGPIKVDTSQPVSVVSFGATPENYLITYGEVCDSNIVAIEITYDNGDKKRVEPRNAAYLFIEEQEVNWLTTINAYDSTGQVVFHLSRRNKPVIRLGDADCAPNLLSLSAHFSCQNLSMPK